MKKTLKSRQRPFTVHFSEPDAADRAEVEQFIRDVFFQVCAAKIKNYLPSLISLRDLDDKIIAAYGIRDAGAKPLFLEHYMNTSVEQLFSTQIGAPVARNDIVEIGNFSVAEMGWSRQLIGTIFDRLHTTSKQWAVFTAVQVVRNSLIKSGINPTILCDADKNTLPLSEQTEWGSYYEQNPQVMAIQRIERRIENRS
ncbi:MAG: thermostable hemolysin [Gallionella sp.]